MAETRLSVRHPKRTAITLTARFRRIFLYNVFRAIIVHFSRANIIPRFVTLQHAVEVTSIWNVDVGKSPSGKYGVGNDLDECVRLLICSQEC